LKSAEQLGFVPVAYLPGFYNDNGCVVDVVKMVKLNAVYSLDNARLTPFARTMVDIVDRNFQDQKVGVAVINLGGGRERETDVIDHSVGLSDVAGLGEKVEPRRRPLAHVHAADEAAAERAAKAVRAAYTLGERAPQITDPVIEVQRAV